MESWGWYKSQYPEEQLPADSQNETVDFDGCLN
jgi:hypothetical protein